MMCNKTQKKLGERFEANIGKGKGKKKTFVLIDKKRDRRIAIRVDGLSPQIYFRENDDKIFVLPTVGSEKLDTVERTREMDSMFSMLAPLKKYTNIVSSIIKDTRSAKCPTVMIRLGDNVTPKFALLSVMSEKHNRDGTHSFTGYPIYFTTADEVLGLLEKVGKVSKFSWSAFSNQKTIKIKYDMVLRIFGWTLHNHRSLYGEISRRNRNFPSVRFDRFIRSRSYRDDRNILLFSFEDEESAMYNEDSTSPRTSLNELKSLLYIGHYGDLFYNISEMMDRLNRDAKDREKEMMAFDTDDFIIE